MTSKDQVLVLASVLKQISTESFQCLIFILVLRRLRIYKLSESGLGKKRGGGLTKDHADHERGNDKMCSGHEIMFQ